MKYQDYKQFCTKQLIAWGLYSEYFVELSAMIAAHESLGGKHRRQLISKGGRLVPEGKARGLFGMEPLTHDSVWDNSDTIISRGRKFGIERSNADRMINDDVYALWMCRHYIAMDSKPLPKTPQSMAEYAKIYWNAGGAASAAAYIRDWQLWKSEV